MADTFFDEFIDYVDANTDFVVGTDLFPGYQPDSPDRAVSIMELPAAWNYSGMRTWQIHVLARAFDFWDARTDSYKMVDLLGNVEGFYLTNYTVMFSGIALPPLPIGGDEAGRIQISSRYTLYFKPI